MAFTQDLKQMAIELGADSVGIANVEAYTAMVPNAQRPDFMAEGMKSIVVMTKHLLTGCLAVEDVATQSTNSHLALDLVDETVYRIAEWLEDRGHAALPISPEYADMDVVWSGGGLLDLKWTAEFAGLGHVGLNLNFLTPDYGSRVYLVALLTDAELTPDSPLDHDLCPGLECGRCGVLCPPKAIPLEAPKDQSVNDYRNLDQVGCSQGAMRISIRSLYSVLRKLMGAPQPVDAMEVLDNRYWQDYYLATNSKRGAFAACFECMYVCPVGAKDVKKIMRIPYRRMDLPPGSVKHDRSGDTHKVGYLGPPKDRDPEYIRDREFDHLVQLNSAPA